MSAGACAFGVVIVRAFNAELSEDERHEIELEENVRRKDLTPYERSREIVKLANVAAGVDKQSFVKSLNEPNKNASKAGSLRRVAARVGMTAPAILNAKQHVAAVSRYPELKAILTQKDAITIAKNLDALSDVERQHARGTDNRAARYRRAFLKARATE